MFSRISAAIAVVVIVAAATWYFKPVQGAAQANALLNQVPADTVYFFAASANKELAEHMANYPIGVGSPSQQAAMDSLLAMGDEQPPLAFFVELFFKPVLNSKTSGELIDHYGFAAGGAAVLYSHGIVPVMRIQLADAKVFDQLVDSAAANSKWTYSTESFEGLTLKRWKLSDEGLDFIIARDDRFVTLTLLSNSDDPSSIKERLGLSNPKNNLVSTGVITELRKKYGFQPYMDGYIHFAHLAEQLVDIENSSLGQDLMRYLPADTFADIEATKDEALQDDIVKIANAVPRWVFGYKNLEFDNNQMQMDFVSVLEIENPVVTTELLKLRGHLPKHVLSVSDSLFSFGIALDSANLLQSLTGLSAAFVGAEFKSEAFKEAQEKAKQANPAMLGMFMGMIQGVKGAGLSVYDVQLNSNSIPSKLDAIFSLATEQPATTMGMVKMLPPLADLELPTDGTAVPLVLPNLPAELNLKAAVKGQHIVVFSGDKASVEAEKLSSESLDTNGLFVSGFNYRKLGTVIDELPMSMPGAQGCVAQQELREFMRSMQMDFNLSYDTSADGLVMGVNANVEAMQVAQVNLGGTYKVDYLDTNCAWHFDGMEYINADGSGRYLAKDKNDSCELYSAAYTWRQEQRKFSLEYSEQSSRETCAEEMTLLENNNESCYLLNIEAEGFQCLFNAGTEDAALYRYHKI